LADLFRVEAESGAGPLGSREGLFRFVFFPPLVKVSFGRIEAIVTTSGDENDKESGSSSSSPFRRDHDVDLGVARPKGLAGGRGFRGVSSGMGDVGGRLENSSVTRRIRGGGDGASRHC